MNTGLIELQKALMMVSFALMPATTCLIDRMMNGGAYPTDQEIKAACVFDALWLLFIEYLKNLTLGERENLAARIRESQENKGQ